MSPRAGLSRCGAWAARAVAAAVVVASRPASLARGDGPAYGWMPDDERVYFLSERDGYFHLYVTGLDGGEPTQLTSGRFGLVDLRLSKVVGW